MSEFGDKCQVGKTCHWCGEYEVRLVDKHGWARFNFGGVHIQNAFPDLPSEEREWILTGTHAKCWDEMFADLDDEDKAEVNPQP